jgi:formamidopyrimidine-DNA glycosylase
MIARLSVKLENVLERTCPIPEGPEILISAEIIRPLVVGKTITDAYSTRNSRYGDSRGNMWLGNLLGEYHSLVKAIEDTETPSTIQAVDTKGKFMYWTFAPEHYMFCTFGMSGQWSPKEGKHPCFTFKFSDDSSVFFNDPRHFGTIKFVNDKQVLTDKLASLGWDPLQDQLSDYVKGQEVGHIKYFDHVQQSLQTTKPIGQVLMDQSVFAGVGNYIRAEALYAAKLSPWRRSKSLSFEEIGALCEAITAVMKSSYQHQGATILTYKDAYGAEGKYSSQFKCYGQKTDPEGHPIIKEPTPDGRTMHWCPKVQL